MFKQIVSYTFITTIMTLPLHSSQQPHCAMIQTDDIQVIIGDADRDGQGGKQYCGVWSLTYKHRAFNVFGNSYAGLIPEDIRGKAPKLEIKSDKRVDLIHSADSNYPVDVKASYELISPNIIEHKLTLRDQKDTCKEGCDFREVVWCSYINSPTDCNMYFISNGQWTGYISPAHGVGSNIAPSYISTDKIEKYPVEKYKHEGKTIPFRWDRAKIRFDEPFYYGRLDEMVLIYVFDKPEWLRFFCSPKGGGPSILPDKKCPAWDFMWVIPAEEYMAGKEYNFKMRAIYKKFISNDDVLMEVKKAREAMKSK